jgi:hypothetical protein
MASMNRVHASAPVVARVSSAMPMSPEGPLASDRPNNDNASLATDALSRISPSITFSVCARAVGLILASSLRIRTRSNRVASFEGSSTQPTPRDVSSSRSSSRPKASSGRISGISRPSGQTGETLFGIGPASPCHPDPCRARIRKVSSLSSRVWPSAI